jgi:radical SAM protein with 4Fe4S-binding SPASM domain
MSVIDEVQRRFKVKTISLSGGEALQYSQFDRIYSFLRDRGFQIKLYSSGIVTDSTGRHVSLSDDTLDRIYINKNNPTVILNVQGATHNLVESINGVEGSFVILENTIRNLRENGFRYCAHTVPFRSNFRNLCEIYEFCRGWGFQEMSLLRFVPQGRGSANLYNSPQEFREIMDQISAIIRRSRDDHRRETRIRLGCPINFLFLLNDDRLPANDYPTHCRGGMDAPVILPTGDVMMCPAWKNLKQFSAGNIYQSDFEDIWNSELFEIFREFVRTGYRGLNSPCGQCEHLESCRGKCVAQRLLRGHESGENALNELLLSAPDPQCFRQVQ